MTRTRLSFPSIPMFLLAAAVVATLAFGLTKYFAGDGTGALPALDVAGDTAAAAPGALNLSKLYQGRVDTTVSINATIDGKPMNGAGVVVDANQGLIVTSSHVIKDYKKSMEATSILVRFHKGDEVAGTLATIDQFNDLAIIKIDPADVTSDLVAAPLANSDKVLVGSEVAAIGAPFGYDWSITPGNVSATHRVIGSRINLLSDIPDAIQFDAAINTGNSGGPLFNARGEVIGVNQQIATPNEGSVGVAFAVSSNLVNRAVRIFQQTGVTQIPYADLGLRTRDVTPQLAKAGQLASSTGALVQSATGPAATAGIGAGAKVPYFGTEVSMGDVIVELADRPVRSASDLERITALLDAEAPVPIVFLRNGKRVEVEIDPHPRQLF